MRFVIVDSHVHLCTDTTGWYSYKKSAGTFDAELWDADRIVRAMDEAAVDRCFLLPMSGLYPFNDTRKSNDDVADAVRRFPDRLIGFCTALPNQDPEGAAREVTRCLHDGLKGVKFHPWLQAFPANSTHLDPCLEVCSRHRLPVLFHTGTPPYSQPFQVMAQARRFPDVPFIIGHFGKLIFLDAVRSAELYPNVYLETSGAQGADIEYALEHIPAERILFGTDLPSGGVATIRSNYVIVDSALTTEEQRRAVFGENALRLIAGVRA